MERETRINHSELTSRGAQPKLKAEGIVFMPEPGGGEGFSITAEGSKPGIVEGAIVTRKPEDIVNPQAREAAIKFIKDMEERPLSAWGEEELRKAYLEQGLMVAKAETEEAEGWKNLSDQMQPFGYVVIREAERRGIDVKPWVYELSSELLERGYVRKSVGADTSDAEEPIKRRPASGQERANQHSFAGGIINPDDYSPEDRGVIDNINRIEAAGLLDADSLTQQLREAVEQGQIQPRDSRRIISEIRQRQQAAAREASGGRTGERIGFYLLESDEVQLVEDPFIWLDDQFDILYNIARQGQELSSPFLQSLNQLFSDASRFVQKYKRDMAEEFNAQYSTRFGQLAMRATIGYRGIEGAKERSASLLAHGFFNGFSLEDGVANSMFNRLNELMEDQRLKQGPTMHVTPEIANTLQEKVIREQIELAKKGIGLFKLKIKNQEGVREEVRASDILGRHSEYVDDVAEMLLNKTQITTEIAPNVQEQIEAVVSGIIRTVRTAYDLSVNSQRQAVIVARGWELRNDEAYWSDPASGILNVYNAEGLLLNKFDLYNPTQWELVRRIKLDMADNEDSDQYGRPGMSEIAKEDLGTRLFRDLFAVPDFFSSPWRIKGVMKSIETRMKAVYGEDVGIAKTKDFGLFLQLKYAGDKKNLRTDAWKKIARFRPEEVMRLYRERAPGNKDLIERLNEKGFEDSIFEDAGIKGKTGSETYDNFKERYGSIIRLVREKGFRELRQINIGSTGADGLSEGDKEIITKFFGNSAEVEKLQRMYAKMTEFASSSIEELMSHNRFEDIYSRTIAVDDALLDRLESNKFWYLEEEKDDQGNIVQKRVVVREKYKEKDAYGKDIEDSQERERDKAFLPISQLFAADQGGDAYVRIWTDTENAMLGMKSLVAFIHSEPNDLQKRYGFAEDFADKVSQYNGHDNRAKIIRYTIGTDLILRKIPMLADALGIAKLPFRMRMTEIEKIYGPHAQNMSRDELRRSVDEYGSKLLKNMSKLNYEQEDKIRKLREEKGDEAAELEKAKYIAENREKAEKYKVRLTELVDAETGLTGGLAKRRALTLVAIIMLLILSETVEATGVKDIK